MLAQPSGRSRARTIVIVLAALLAAAFLAAPGLAATDGAQASAVNSKTFPLFPNRSFLNCAQAPGKRAVATARVTRGADNDTLTLTLSGFRPGLGFDMFTVERSNQTATGAPVAGFKNFGLAWYQSDVHTNSQGAATVTIKTILFDQIFGFDAGASLAPTNTFHVGFWFDSVREAQPCSAAKLTATPFNGEHNAGPLAFITRPDARTGLGPLCTAPVHRGAIFTCNP